MAEVSKPSKRSTISSLMLPPNCRTSGLICGEDIAAMDACYVKSDGKVWRANGTAATAPARVRGFAAEAAFVAQNDAVTLVQNTEVGFANTLTIGADLYLSATVPGGLATVATTGGVNPIAYVKDANCLVLLPIS